jgi:hypothetical protein
MKTPAFDRRRPRAHRFRGVSPRARHAQRAGASVNLDLLVAAVTAAVLAELEPEPAFPTRFRAGAANLALAVNRTRKANTGWLCSTESTPERCRSSDNPRVSANATRH